MKFRKQTTGFILKLLPLLSLLTGLLLPMQVTFAAIPYNLVSLDNRSGTETVDGQVLIRLRDDFDGWSYINTDFSNFKVLDNQNRLLSWWVAPGFSVANKHADIYVKASVPADTIQTISFFYNQTSSTSNYTTTMSKIPEIKSSTTGSYDFSESNGSIAHDLSGYNRDITLNNITWASNGGGNYKDSVPSIPFTTGSQLIFNGNSFAENATLLATSSQSRTISLGVTFGSMAGGPCVFSKISKLDGPNGPMGVDLCIDPQTDKLKFTIYKTVNGIPTSWIVTSTSNIIANIPYNIQLLDGAGGMQMWLNGNLEGTNASLLAWGNGIDRPFLLGAKNVDGILSNFLFGKIDYLMVDAMRWEPNQIKAAVARLKYFDTALQNKAPQTEVDSPSTVTIISGDNGPDREFDGLSTAVFEPNPFLYNDGITVGLVYSAGYTLDGSPHYGLHRLTFNNLNDLTDITKHNVDTPFLGMGNGGEEGIADRPLVYHEPGNNRIYVFYSDSVSSGNWKYVYTDDDFATLSSPSLVLSKMSPPDSAINGYANSWITKEASGTYNLFLEASYRNGPDWVLTHWTANTFTDLLDGNLNFHGLESNLQPPISGSSYSKASLFRVNGLWHAINHGSGGSGVLPSWIWHYTANSLNGNSWTKDINNPLYEPTAGYDQVADVQAFEASGKVLIFHDRDYNGTIYRADVRAFIYLGTLSQFFNGRPTPKIGPVQVMAIPNLINKRLNILPDLCPLGNQC